MKPVKQNYYTDEWRHYSVTKVFIDDAAKQAFPKDSKRQQEFKKHVFDKITPDLIQRSGAEYYPDRRLQPDYIKVRRELYSEMDKAKKTLLSQSRTSNPKQEYNLQLNIVKKLSFIDAIMPIPDFTKWVVLLRSEFDIDPKKVKKKLGFSNEEIETATTAASPAQHDALIKQLYGAAEMRKRRGLIEIKNAFERDFFVRYYARKKKQKLLKNVLDARPLRIPKSQEPHMRNYILYGAKTGKLISTAAAGDGLARAWQNRLLGTKKSKHGYVPFLRYWLYYFTRKVQKRSPLEARRELARMGLPSEKRENDYVLINRYERLFLK